MSLRRRLIVGVALALALGVVLAATLSGIAMHRQVHDLLDHNLIQIAQIAAQIEARGPESALVALRRPADSAIIVQRWRGDSMVGLVQTSTKVPKPDQEGFRNVQLRGFLWRAYALATSDGWVVVAQRLESRGGLISAAMFVAILPILICLPLVALLVAAISRHALQPLEGLTRELEQRQALSNAPLNVDSTPTEVRPLIEAFNGLLLRVIDSIKRERGFVIDAAHALRTPITALQLQADSVSESKSKADFEERLRDLRGGIFRARRTVEQLLELARSEHANSGITDVAQVLETLPESFAALASEKRVVIDCSQTDVHAHVPLRPAALSVALHNLVDNALRYSPSESTIVIAATVVDGYCEVRVTDQGCGLALEEREHVFDRFYRASDDLTAGTGLGLSIVRAIAQSAGGSASLETTQHATGLTALLRLPLMTTREIPVAREEEQRANRALAFFPRSAPPVR